MPKITAAVAALLLVLALAGCGDDDTTASDNAARGFAASEATGAPSDTPTPAPTATLTAEDDGFLAYVRSGQEDLAGWGVDSRLPMLTDAEVIAAGHDACEQIRSGVKYEDLRLVEGEEPFTNGGYYDSSTLFNGALLNYCTDLLPPPSED